MPVPSRMAASSSRRSSFSRAASSRNRLRPRWPTILSTASMTSSSRITWVRATRPPWGALSHYSSHYKRLLPREGRARSSRGPRSLLVDRLDHVTELVAVAKQDGLAVEVAAGGQVDGQPGPLPLHPEGPARAPQLHLSGVCHRNGARHA